MRGFSGLDHFATDVDAAVAASDRIASSSRPEAARPEPAQLQPDSSEEFGHSALGRSIKSIGGWAVGIGILLLIKFAILRDEPTEYAEAGDSTEYAAAPELSDGSDASADTVEIPAAEALESTAEESPAPGDEAYGYDDPAYPTLGEVADEAASQPPSGTVPMNRAELRYCMEETERLKGEKAEMERIQYLDTERFNANVDAFNERINELRSGCSGQYRVSDETAINGELALRRYSLQREGSSRVQ